MNAYPPAPRTEGAMNILGLPLHPVTADQIEAFVDRVIAGREKAWVLNLNVHCANLALNLPWLRRFLHEAQLVFCDGDGIRWAAKLLGLQQQLREVMKVHYRVQYGVKEELLPLLKLQGIGRIRARKLYSNGIRDLGDVKKADLMTLGQLLGKHIAADLKKQVGENVDKLVVKEGKRKGQISLNDY